MNPETAGTAGRILLNILGRSWRITRLRSSSGIRSSSALFAFWHGVQLPLMYTHRNMGIRIMISGSRDGSFVSCVCERMGFNPVRGSSSRGGVAAAREQINAMRLGIPGAISPDGPRGPAEIVKKGVSLLPVKADVPVVPYGVCGFPVVKLRSWDRFMIPLPLAKLVVSEGKPIPPRFCSPETLTAAIKCETARATLAACPLPFLEIAFIRIAASALSPVVSLVLLSRPARERRERKGFIKESFSRPVWLHGSSLGEMKGLLPVIEKLKQINRPLFVTCSTPAAREFIDRENLPGSFLPVDTPGAVTRFLNRLMPSALILAETEFWPVLLHETVLRGITAGMVNARLSEKSVTGYRFIKPLFSGILSCFRGILARTETDTERFLKLGVNTVTAGDGKAAVKPPNPDPAWRKKIKPGPGGILVAGSTRSGEEEIILEIARIAGLTPVLVPRHENRITEVVRIASNAGFKPDLWTDNCRESTCLVVDVRGILSSLYGLADIAFVGGTLVPIGGHNILEPLAHGIPVIVGPSHFHFTDIVKQGVKGNICRVINDAEQGASAVEELLDADSNIDSKNIPQYSDLFLLKLNRLFKKMGIGIPV